MDWRDARATRLSAAHNLPPAGAAVSVRETTDYRAALEWLFQFADWERGVGWNPAASADQQWKLGRPRALLDLVGAPDGRFRTVLIAGTKGKGSTAAMLEAIVRASGSTTGLYTQPHLHSYRERIRLDGVPIAPGRFAELVGRLRPAVDELRGASPAAGDPTTFELTTVLALLAFAEAGVGLVILEVGLGGRLDATNVVDPVVSVITPIGLDHTQILGDTIAEIAREKAGIIRRGGVVISARQRPEARRAILTACDEANARCRFVHPYAARPRDGALLVRLGHGRRIPMRLSLAGAHQRQNAAVAVAVALELRRQGLPLTDESVERGFSSVRWPGRFEVVRGRPVVVVDTAHNPDSASALARAMRDAALPRPRWLLLGIYRDKDALAVARALAPKVDGIVATSSGLPRSLDAGTLAAACRRAGARDVRTAASVPDGLDLARELAGSSGSVVVAGSFSVAAEARVQLGLELDEP
jgi:dihydrofolate synthase / folylpolyglutamate synthase